MTEQIERAAESQAAESADAPPRNANHLALDRVNLTYGGAEPVETLRDVTFSVAEGDFVAVVGPSGCGKSSLMKLVSGLLPPTTGAISVAGAEVAGPTDTVGMAFQNPALLPWRTALSNVLLPLEVVARGRAELRTREGRAAAEARAMKLLDLVGLGDAAQLRPGQLSGGMRQRVSLCRSLIHQPKLLILDEPFGALDAFTREELWGVLYRLWRETRFTCVLVTHDLREASLLASRIVVLSKRPAGVRAIHEPPFPHPRDPDVLYAAEMAEFTKMLRAEIGDAMRA